MRRTEARHGVRMIKLRSVLDRYEASELSCLEAAELLGEAGQRFRQAQLDGMASGGMGVRTFRRWRHRFEEDGEAGLVDRRLEKVSGREVPAGVAMHVAELYRTRFAGFTAKHFHEHLVRDHGFRWGYTWTKTFLHSRGLLERAKARGAHRRKRPRRPLRGMMLHQPFGGLRRIAA